MWGNLAYVGYSQGLNMLLNVFFGPIVNAARSISLQISGGQHITGEKSGYRMSGEDAVVGYVLSGRKCNRFYRRR